MFRALSIVTLTIGFASLESAAQPAPTAQPAPAQPATKPAPPKQPAPKQPTPPKQPVVDAAPATKVPLLYRSWVPRSLPVSTVAPLEKRTLPSIPLANVTPVGGGGSVIPTSDRGLDTREQLRGLVTTQSGEERLATLDKIAELSVKIAAGSPTLAYREEALKDSHAVVSDPGFSAYKGAESALARLAAVQVRENKHEEAAQTYAQLVAKFPKSQRVAEAHVYAGDRAYEKKQMKEAIASYESALAVKATPVAAYAKYKLAWAKFNAGDHKAAMALFTSVAATGPEPLKAAAAKGAARVYAEVGAPAQSIAFAEKLDRTRGLELARDLAETYAERGNHAAAKTSWLAIAKREKVAATACNDRLRAFRATVALDDRAEILRMAGELVGVAAKGGPECAARIDQAVGEVAYAWHLERDRRDADPAQTIAMWTVADKLATTSSRKQTIARDIAIATWVKAARNGGANAQLWIDVATLLETSPEKDLASASIDAWDNAIRAARATAKPLTAAQQARVKAGLEKNATPRAKLLVESFGT